MALEKKLDCPEICLPDDAKLPVEDIIRSWKKRSFNVDYTSNRPESKANLNYEIQLYSIKSNGSSHGVTVEDTGQKEIVHSDEFKCDYERRKVIIKHNGQEISLKEASKLVPSAIPTRARKYSVGRD